MKKFKQNITESITQKQSRYSYKDFKLTDLCTVGDKFQLEKTPIEVTELFVKSLCKILKIPFKFAMIINPKLFEDNINTLIAERDDLLVTICFEVKEEEAGVIGDILPKVVNIVETTIKKFWVPEIDYVLEGVKFREWLKEGYWIPDYGYSFLYVSDEPAPIDDRDGIFIGMMLKIPMFLADKKIVLEQVLFDSVEGTLFMPNVKPVGFGLMTKNPDDKKLPNKLLDKLNGAWDLVDVTQLAGHYYGMSSEIVSRDNLLKIWNKLFKISEQVLVEFGIETVEDLQYKKTEAKLEDYAYTELIEKSLNFRPDAIGLDEYYKLMNNKWISKLYSKQMEAHLLEEKAKEETKKSSK